MTILSFGATWASWALRIYLLALLGGLGKEDIQLGVGALRALGVLHGLCAATAACHQEAGELGLLCLLRLRPSCRARMRHATHGLQDRCRLIRRNPRRRSSTGAEAAQKRKRQHRRPKHEPDGSTETQRVGRARKIVAAGEDGRLDWKTRESVCGNLDRRF